MFRIIGRTKDNKNVVAGVYKFYESVGLPLADIFAFLKSKQCIPSWLHFCQEAINAGMNINRIINKLEEPLVDIYGGAFTKIVLNTIQNHYSSGFLAGPETIIN